MGLLSAYGGDEEKREDNPRNPKSNGMWLLITAVAGVIIAAMAAHSLGGLKPYPPPVAHAQPGGIGSIIEGNRSYQSAPSDWAVRAMPFWGLVPPDAPYGDRRLLEKSIMGGARSWTEETENITVLRVQTNWEYSVVLLNLGLSQMLVYTVTVYYVDKEEK